jgi:hypothetical protein
MSRIYDADNNPVDFCNYCFPPSEDEAEEEYPNNCGWDCSHPPYEECEEYHCHVCGILLESEDD